MSLALFAWGRKPHKVGFPDVLRHHRRWDDIIHVLGARIGFGKSIQHPEEQLAVVLFGLLTDGASATPWHEGLHLDVNEPRALDVAAQDIRVGTVAVGDDGDGASA